MDRKKAYTFALLAVLFWSTIPTAFKITLRCLDIYETLFFSALVSFIFLLMIIVFSGKTAEFKSAVLSSCRSSAILGFLNPFLYYIVIFEAYNLLPAQEAQSLNYTWALALALLSIPILKQKIRMVHIISTIICLAGIFVIASRGNFREMKFENPLGVGLAVGSSVIWALYWIYNTKDRREPVIKLAANFFYGTLFSLVLYITVKGLHIPPVKGLTGSLYIGIFEMGLTFVLWLTALKLAPTTAHIGILIFLAPFLSFVFIAVIVGEKILPSSVAGLVLIVSGIILQKYYEMKKELGKNS